MKKITPQRVLDAAREAFVVNNGKPSYDNDGEVCMYRSGKKRCAVGLLIPDGHEAENLVGGVVELRSKYPSLFLNGKSIEKIAKLQIELHDDIQTAGRWDFNQRKRDAHYATVAKSLKLKYKRVFADD